LYIILLYIIIITSDQTVTDQSIETVTSSGTASNPINLPDQTVTNFDINKQEGNYVY